MAQTGSSIGMVSQSLTATVDPQGNPLISSDTAFGSSPAGVALLGQQLFGLPNATFNLTPPDVFSQLGPENELPYWTFDDFSDGEMTATPIYDSTAQTWGITINPGTAVSGDYCALTTRSYLINDDNLGLRQKAFAVIAKTGTAAGTTQWNLTLDAIYYDTTDTAIGTATLGTALDTGTWTSISGFTTAGGSAIPATAHFVELQFKVTATATITGSAVVTIKSCLLSSKVGATGAFLITDTYTSSGTWTAPTGVTALVALVGSGAGGGGAGGGLIGSSIGAAGTANTPAARGGGSGAWTIVRDVPVTSGSAYSIGIGAGGAGGTAQAFSKANGSTSTAITNQASGAAGGATTFGTFFSIGGGGGATGAVVSVTGTHANGVAGTAGVVSAGIFGATGVSGKTGEASGNATTNWDSALIYPYTTAQTGGLAGASGSSSGTAITAFAGTAGTISSATANMLMSGAAADSSTWSSPFTQSDVGNSGNSTGAGGAAGASSCVAITATGVGTVTCTAGAAGSAVVISGCGGSGGGNAVVSAASTSTFRDRPVVIASGRGGSGQQGFITVVYIA